MLTLTFCVRRIPDMASIIIHIYQILFNYIELLQTIRVLRISDVTNVLQLHKAVMLLSNLES